MKLPPSLPFRPGSLPFVRALQALWGGLSGACGELLGPRTCAACDATLKRPASFCGACAATLQAAPDRPGISSFGLYGGALAEAIGLFKYEARPDLQAQLSALLLRVPLPGVDASWIVAPVPLHPQRLRARGYNQAALIAAPLADRLGADWQPRLLLRVRATAQQALLDRGAREANVRFAFTARHPQQVAGRRVLLVDDVATSGSTLQACARSLREAGAAQVHACTLARAPLDDELL